MSGEQGEEDRKIGRWGRMEGGGGLSESRITRITRISRRGMVVDGAGVAAWRSLRKQSGHGGRYWAVIHSLDTVPQSRNVEFLLTFLPSGAGSRDREVAPTEVGCRPR
ncbi:MAG: hypothetical protein OXN17_02545 [Candidatus Poribacteria bacterium]|nr:hypothetical protein [Candidatus Poribacteria bacterium]